MRGYLLCCAAVVVGVLVYRIGTHALATPVHEIIVLSGPQAEPLPPSPPPSRSVAPTRVKGSDGDILISVTRHGEPVASFGLDCFHEGRATTCYVEEGDDGAYGTTTTGTLDLALAPLGVVTGVVPFNTQVRYRHGSTARVTSPSDLDHGYAALAANDRGRFSVRIFDGPGTILIFDDTGRLAGQRSVIGTGQTIDLGSGR